MILMLFSPSGFSERGIMSPIPEASNLEVEVEAAVLLFLLSVAGSEERRRRLETSLEKRRLEGEQLVSEAAMIVRIRNWKMRFLRENILNYNS